MINGCKKANILRTSALVRSFSPGIGFGSRLGVEGKRNSF